MTILTFNIARLAEFVPVRHECDGHGAGKARGRVLKAILAKLTNGKFSGLLTGLAVTAVIQSSFGYEGHGRGLCQFGAFEPQAVHSCYHGREYRHNCDSVVKLSLSGISGGQPVRAAVEAVVVHAGAGCDRHYSVSDRKGQEKGHGPDPSWLRDADVRHGIAVWLCLRAADDPNFTKFFLLFSNPILGVLAGAILTGIVQSSSASVGILQALSSTGAVSYGAAIPIIMGQNIGTCVTAMLSSVGTNKNARRAAVVHLSFNIIGTVVWLALFEAANAIFRFAFVSTAIDTFHIALIHSIFNLACTLMLLPCCGLLEKLSYRIIPDGRSTDTATVLDERLFATPAIALVKSEELAKRMAADSELALHESLQAVLGFTPELAASVRQREDDTDRYEDTLGTFLVHLATQPMSEQDSVESSSCCI